MRSGSPAGQVIVRSRVLSLKAAFENAFPLYATQGQQTISPPRPRISSTSGFLASRLTLRFTPLHPHRRLRRDQHLARSAEDHGRMGPVDPGFATDGNLGLPN